MILNKNVFYIFIHRGELGHYVSLSERFILSVRNLQWICIIELTQPVCKSSFKRQGDEGKHALQIWLT